MDFLNEGNPEVIREAIWSCYQEEPVQFGDYFLHDPGAYPERPLCRKITWKVTRTELEPKTEEERKQTEKLKDMMERIRKKVEKRKLEI